MKIDEFSIRRYEPLPEMGRIRLGNFNLFFGNNEDGKTLTIDALVKMLFRQNREVFEHVNRVDEDPDGYVVIEDDKGKKVKLPEKGDLAKITGLSSWECRNIFIIRNSDLSIARESEFYTNVTDRLTGLRTTQISSIKDKLQEIGKLTKADSSASLSDDSRWGKIKTKAKNAKELTDNINELEKKIQEEKFGQIEEEVSEVTETMIGTQQKLDEEEDARKREMYEKGDDALGKLKVTLENLEGQNVEEIKKLKSKLDNYKENQERLSCQKPKSKFLTKATIISAVLLLTSIFGVIVTSNLFVFILAALFIVSTIVLGALEFSFVIKEVQLTTIFKEIKTSASQLGVGADSVEGIYSNVQKVDENLRSKEEAEIRLDSYFSKKGKDLTENLSFWEHEIKALKEYKDKAKHLKYDEKNVSHLKNEMMRLSNKKDELQKRMKNIMDTLKEVERKANEILQLEEEYLHCDTSVDLDAIRDALKGFMGKVENDKNITIQAIKIFEEIGKEEEEEVSLLFGKDSLVSKYFSEITGGIYQQVEFIPEEKKIQVTLKNGDIFDAEKLSGGAYDQLYLSIRLALGEKLLKGSKGFFIMDDPFIKADKDRLKKQINILRKVSKLRWQIIYFTAKDEVRDIMKEDIESNQVNYIEIQPIYSKT